MKKNIEYEILISFTFREKNKLAVIELVTKIYMPKLDKINLL